MQIRLGNSEDLIFLKEMLFEAFFWKQELLRPKLEEFFENPEISKLILNWGRVGDRLLIAEQGNKRIGAAWYRLWSESDQSYGYIDSNTPELGMGIYYEYRSKGIGRILLKRLIPQ